MKIVESMMTKNPCFIKATPLRVAGLMLHSVGVPQPRAEVFAHAWDSPEENVSVHAFVDGLTGTVYQTLPWDYKAWHCGPQGGNSRYIGVEMCEPACIKYSGGTFTCQDEAGALEVVTRTYHSAVELFAYLCKRYQLDPLADGAVISHREGYQRNIASNHGDPEHLWNGLHSGYTMDGFRKAVAAAMTAAPSEADQADTHEADTHEADAETGEAASDIHIGSAVALTPDAVYYDGRLMPQWVKADRWIVKRINGDRVVINENVSCTKAINSPVNIKFLRAVR